MNFSVNLENRVKTNSELHSGGDDFSGFYSGSTRIFLGKAASLWQAFFWSLPVGSHRLEDFRFLLSLCRKFTLETSAQWASGHAKSCNTRVVPVSKCVLLFSNSLEWHMFLKVTFRSAVLVIVVNVFSNILEHVANWEIDFRSAISLSNSLEGFQNNSARFCLILLLQWILMIK